MVICLKQGADLHRPMFQLMPLPLTISCYSKIWYQLTWVVPPDKGPLNGCVCVCVCVCVSFVNNACLYCQFWRLQDVYIGHESSSVDLCGASGVARCGSQIIGQVVVELSWCVVVQQDGGPLLVPASTTSTTSPLSVRRQRDCNCGGDAKGIRKQLQGIRNRVPCLLDDNVGPVESLRSPRETSGTRFTRKFTQK